MENRKRGENAPIAEIALCGKNSQRNRKTKEYISIFFPRQIYLEPLWYKWNQQIEYQLQNKYYFAPEMW